MIASTRLPTLKGVITADVGIIGHILDKSKEKNHIDIDVPSIHQNNCEQRFASRSLRQSEVKYDRNKDKAKISFHIGHGKPIV